MVCKWTPMSGHVYFGPEASKWEPVDPKYLSTYLLGRTRNWREEPSQRTKVKLWANRQFVKRDSC